MDKEDKMFVKVVGEKGVRILKRRYPRLYELFAKRCEENGESPEKVLGRYALRFANSVIDGDEFADDVLDKEIKLTAIVTEEDLVEIAKTVKRIKEELFEEKDEIEDLIKSYIENELKKTTSSPLQMLAREEQQQPQQIVIDDNLLRQLSIEQLNQLEELVKYVKEEKLMSTKKVEEVIEGGEKEEVAEGDKRSKRDDSRVREAVRRVLEDLGQGGEEKSVETETR